MSKPTLGYWAIRGMVESLSYQLAYSKVDYEMKDYHSPQAWFGGDKADGLGLDFPNLPYWKDGDFGLTETLAIHKYLADRYSPSLLGANAQEKATIEMLKNVIQAAKSGCTGLTYS